MSIFSFLLPILFQLFLRIESYKFYLTMYLEGVDDCISKIYKSNNITLFERECSNVSNWDKPYNSPLFEKIEYEFGEEIYIDIFDKGDIGYLKINVRLNEYLIKPELQKFWNCTNCLGENNNYIYNTTLKRFDFYNPDIGETTERTYNFIFKVDSRDMFKDLEGVVDGNYYTISQVGDQYIHLNDLDDEIILIDFKNQDNFYITHNKEYEIQFDSIYFRIFHDNHFRMNGEITGFSFWDNEYKQLLNDGDALKVTDEYSTLKYKLTEKEKSMNGTQIIIFLRAYNSPDKEDLRKEVSQLIKFNYYVCLKGYTFCDPDSSFKCLKDEGFFKYEYNGVIKYYSCYERCGNCETYKRYPFASIENNYCDQCHSKYPLYIQLLDNDNNKYYNNCYEECPLPYYKNDNSNECLKCTNYITNDLNCVDDCDSIKYKYMEEQIKICYDFIPNNYYAYIDNYNLKYYDDTNSPIIKISKDCPNDSFIKYDDSFCLTSIKDVFSLISPLYFNQYKNPIKIELKDRTIYIRIYTSDTTYDELIKKYPDYSNIDISECEIILKNKYNINVNLFIYDINDLINNEYEFKIYSLEGKELDINYCINEGISFCQSGFYKNENGECIECPEQCFSCSYESVQNNLCIKCNNQNNYYEKNINTNNDNKEQQYISCINEENKPNNYYFNINKLRYEPCYKTCKECFNYGDDQIHNCTNCISGFKIIEEYPYNCVKECPFYYYYNELNEYKCTKNEECPEDYRFLLKNKNKCVNNCSNYFPYIHQYQNNCLDKCPLGTIINNNNICINKDLNNECFLVEKKLNIDIFDLIDEIENNIDNLIKEYIITHQGINSEIYLYKNEKYKFVIYKNEECLNNYIEQNIINIPKLDFDNCINDLKNNCSLNIDENITIVLIDIPRGNQSSFTYYNFYNPENADKLDFMNICQNYKVKKLINIFSLDMNNKEGKKRILSQNIDIFNKSTSFFTDICFSFNSPNEKDIPLKERILDYFPNIKLCDSGCRNMGIDYQNYEVLCECTFSNIINSNIINNYFTGEVVELITNTNLEVLKCYNSIFMFKGLKESYGGLIIITLFIIQIILNILFFKNGFTEERRFAIALMYCFINSLKKNTNKSIVNDDKIDNIYSKKDIKEKNNNIDKVISNELNNDITNKNNKISFPPRKNTKKRATQPINYFNIINQPDDSNNQNSTNKNFLVRNHNKYNSQKILGNINPSNNNKQINVVFKNTVVKNINKYSNKTINIYNKEKNFEEIFPKYQLSEKEFLNYMKKPPDDMIYEEALSEDKRNLRKIYLSILMQKQPILNIIYEQDKLRPRLLKIIIHILTIDLFFVFNGLFFSEEYIDELYLSKREEKFFSFIPRSIDRIIYASIVTVIVNFLINCILINTDKIRSTLIREQNNTTIMKGEIGQILFRMEKSIKVFLFVNFLIMIFSWYYIVCFNYVYHYTKKEWIKSSILIIILEEIFPFLFSLIIALLRFLSLYCKSEQIYKISSSL